MAQSGKPTKTSPAHGLEMAGRDYDALWELHYRRARRAGMADNMARFVARTAVHDQLLVDRGLAPVGSGDIEAVY